MLAGLLENNNNVRPRPQPVRQQNFESGGGGGWPQYEIVDYIAAMASFQEMPGEHPVARAVRHQQHLRDALPIVGQWRERQQAAAFLAGASVATSAAEETLAQCRSRISELEQALANIKAAPPVPERNSGASRIIPALCIVGAIALVAILLSRA